MEFLQDPCQDLFHKFRVELEKTLKEKITQELRQEYEEKLAASKKEHQTKIQKIKKEMEVMKEKMANMERIVMNFNEETNTDSMEDNQDSTPTDRSLDDEVTDPLLLYKMSKTLNGEQLKAICMQPRMGRTLTEEEMKFLASPSMDFENLPPPEIVKHEDNVPLILRPGVTDILHTVVEKLDPATFVRLIQASTTFYSLAKSGNLKVPLKLVFYTYEQSDVGWEDNDVAKTAVLLYNDIPLGFKELNFINRANYFRTEVIRLALGRFSKDEQKMIELLDYVGVTYIDYAAIEARIDVTRFLKKYRVRSLNLSALSSASFLSMPEITHIEKLVLTFPRALQAIDISLVEKFLLTPTTAHLCISGARMSDKIVLKLTEMWINNETDFKSLYFELDTEGPRRFIADLEHGNFLRNVPHQLAQLNEEDIKNIVINLVPTIICGADNCVVVIRNDLSMLRIRYNNWFSQDWSVQLKNLSIADED